jgi:hypothetical protein
MNKEEANPSKGFFWLIIVYSTSCCVSIRAAMPRASMVWCHSWCVPVDLNFSWLQTALRTGEPVVVVHASKQGKKD